MSPCDRALRSSEVVGIQHSGPLFFLTVLVGVIVLPISVSGQVWQGGPIAFQNGRVCPSGRHTGGDMGSFGAGGGLLCAVNQTKLKSTELN